MQRPAPEPGYFLEDDAASIAEQMVHVDTSAKVAGSD
jgi:hypothetical protein